MLKPHQRTFFYTRAGVVVFALFVVKRLSFFLSLGFLTDSTSFAELEPHLAPAPTAPASTLIFKSLTNCNRFLHFQFTCVQQFR
jgi:hypothetical protein